MSMYSDNLEVLCVHRRKHRRFYKDLIKLYNQQVLPELYPIKEERGPLAGMTAGRKAIMDIFMMEESDDSEKEEEEGGMNDGEGGEDSGD
ncbi:hypothetical protein FRC12_024620 [Ceratobasidium sp. 428]|nr:hypothetical protein FRC12_024620 [Ceratobasidium sp. 428]